MNPDDEKNEFIEYLSSLEIHKEWSSIPNLDKNFKYFMEQLNTIDNDNINAYEVMEQIFAIMEEHIIANISDSVNEETYPEMEELIMNTYRKIENEKTQK